MAQTFPGFARSSLLLSSNWAMALFHLPRDVKDLLLEYEFHGKSFVANPLQSRHNVVLDDIAIETFQHQTYMLGIPQMVEGATFDMVKSNFFPLGPDEPLSLNRDMVWMQNFHPDMPSSGKVLLFNVRDGMEMTQQQQTQWVCDEETVVLPLEERGLNQLRIFETYAGGYGGWASAFRFLKAHCQIPCQVIGIEEDYIMAQQYCMNHGATLVDGHFELERNVFTKNHQDFLIHGDIRSRRWWQSIAHWAPHVLTISSPCPPWTGASHSQGLKSPLGMLMAETFALLRVFRPKIVAVEQVHAFVTHEDKKICIAIMKSAGYMVTYSQVVDAAKFGASTRIRWLCIGIRKNAEGISIRPFQMWPVDRAKTPDELGAIVNSFNNEPRLKIDHDTWTRAMDKNLLPPNDRLKHSHSSPQQVMDSRCYDAFTQHPTFMAQYGQQHQLGYYYLCEKGLLAHFLKVDGLVPRYLHPLEIAMMHVSWDRIWISKELPIPWKMIGNCITLPHALLIGANVVAMIDEFQEIPSVEHIFEAVLQQRLKATNLKEVSNEHGTLYYDASHENQDDWNQYIESLVALQSPETQHSLPRNFAWSPKKGLFDMQQLNQTNIDEYGRTIVESEITEVELSQELSPTQNFVPMLKAMIQVEGKHGQIWISGGISTTQIANIFDGKLVIHFVDEPDVPYQLILTKAGNRQTSESKDFNGATILIQSNQMNIVAIKPSDPIREQFVALGIDDNTCDLWGPFTPEDKFQQGQILTDVQIEGRLHGDIWFLLAAIKQTCTQFHWMIDTWHWIIKIDGQNTAKQYLGDFWKNLLSNETKEALGIRVHQVIQDCSMIVQFTIEDPFIPLPGDCFARLLVGAATKAILNSQVDRIEGIPIQLKWAERIIWDGMCNKNLHVEVLADLLGYAFCPILGSDLRIVVGGKTYYNICLGRLAETLQKTSLKLHLLGSMHGGGAKENQRITIKNSVATTLLEQGYEIAWVSKAVETVLQKAGTKRLAQLSQLPAGKNRVDQIQQVLQECSVEVPKDDTMGPQKIASTIASNKQRKKNVIQPCAQHYTIEKGFLCNGDDSVCEQVSEIRPGQTGVILVDYDKAIPWLRESTILSPDEFALLIIGRHETGAKLQSTVINVPCIDAASRPTILLCTMVQLGQKPVKMKKVDTKKVTHEDCQVVSFTLWKSDFTEKDWNGIVDQTSTFIRKSLEAEDLAESLIAIWGRAFRNQKSPTTAAYATSVQMHATIKQSKLKQLLQISGFNKVFVTPKDDQGRISQQWRVIWCEGDVAHLQTLAAATTACLGLIRANNKLGLRFERSEFEGAWKTIYPSKDIPIDMVMSFIYRIEPLPYGTTAANLIEWSKYCGWKLKPIKASGPKAWIVGADSQPVNSFMLYNGHPLIVKLVPPKNSPTTTAVLAGPKPGRFLQEVSNKADGLQLHDPWANYNPIGAGGPVASPAMPRELSGPTQKRFQEQDEKLGFLEKQIETLRTDTQNGMEKLKTEQDLSHKQLVSTMQTMKKEIDTSVATAMKHQSSQLESTLHELKELFMKKAEKPDNKRPAETADMEF